MRLRFTDVFYSGGTVRTELWEEGAALRFRATEPARGATVIAGGFTERDVPDKIR